MNKRIQWAIVIGLWSILIIARMRAQRKMLRTEVGDDVRIEVNYRLPNGKPPVYQKIDKPQPYPLQFDTVR